jgi:hypothetical protein
MPADADADISCGSGYTGPSAGACQLMLTEMDQEAVRNVKIRAILDPVYLQFHFPQDAAPPTNWLTILRNAWRVVTSNANVVAFPAAHGAANPVCYATAGDRTLMHVQNELLAGAFFGSVAKEMGPNNVHARIFVTTTASRMF